MDHRDEVREFLISRRAKIPLAEAGLPIHGERRVPGSPTADALDLTRLLDHSRCWIIPAHNIVTRPERGWGVPAVRPSTECSSPLGRAPSVDVMPNKIALDADGVDEEPTGSWLSATPTAPSATQTPPRATPTHQETHPVTTLRITIGGQTVTAELNDTPTAQDLARQLPLTITLDDFNNVEKVGELPQPLTMDGVPAGADPEINDIGYYRPTNGLVFYYGDVGYFNGIVRIGSLSAADMELIRSQTGNFTITIEES